MITMESSLGHKDTEHHAIAVSIKQTPHHVMWSLGCFPLMPPGGGGYSLNGSYGEALPEGGTFFTLCFFHTTFIKPTRVCGRV